MGAKAYLIRAGIIVVVWTAIAGVGSLEAQRFPGLGALELRAGIYSPENAELGYGAAGDLDLGWIRFPHLRVIAGAHYFTADVDQATAADGDSYAAYGGRAGLRLVAPLLGRLRPHVVAALTGSQVDADVADPRVRELLEAFYLGADVGVGASWALGEAEALAIAGEVRRTFSSNIDRYAFEMGVRYTPRGSYAYFPEPVPVLGVDPAAAEQARLEAERLRADSVRLAEERAREAERRAEEDLLAERRQAEAVTTEAQREAERARRAAAEAQQALQAEAEARRRAEEEAAAARVETEMAERAAREAGAQAREAERRLYESLLDLDRLMTNVTAIRETERGLAVVLGQGLFASGQSSLSPRARDEVGRIAAVLRQYPGRQIAVEGHTDAVGSEALNQRLSEQRAQSVQAALIAEGIDPDRVAVAGYGESRPVAGNETAAGRAETRRVEIVVLGAQRPAPAGP